jgi:hypothetical protein
LKQLAPIVHEKSFGGSAGLSGSLIGAWKRLGSSPWSALSALKVMSIVSKAPIPVGETRLVNAVASNGASSDGQVMAASRW